MQADLKAIGVRLGLANREDHEDSALATVLDHLQQVGEDVLLIYENATNEKELRPCLPSRGDARILVTSNNHAWHEVGSPIEVPRWPKDIGAKFLIARSGRASLQAEAEALSEALGGLPLAHEMAAAFCEQREISLAAYHERFQAQPNQFLSDEEYAPVEYGSTVTKAFNLAIEAANSMHPAAEPLIVHIAMLPLRGVPIFLFFEGRERLEQPLASRLCDDGLEKAIAALRAFSLVSREEVSHDDDDDDLSITVDTICLHRLVREAASNRRHKEVSETIRRALVEALAVVWPDFDHLNDDSDQVVRLYYLCLLRLRLIAPIAWEINFNAPAGGGGRCRS